MSEFLRLAISFLTIVCKAIADVPAMLVSMINYVVVGLPLVSSSIAIFPTMISSVMFFIVFVGILGIIGRLLFGSMGKQ